jgi:hypothetical protein
MKNLKNILASLVLVTMIGVGSTFAADDAPAPACVTSEGGIMISGFTGIMISGFTGIMISGFTGIMISGDASSDLPVCK